MDVGDSKKRKREEEYDVHQPFTKKRKIRFDLETNFVLPQEIMIEIMEQLRPAELVLCSEVCKYWLHCSTAIVRWSLVGTARIALESNRTQFPQFFGVEPAGDALGDNAQQSQAHVSTFLLKPVWAEHSYSPQMDFYYGDQRVAKYEPIYRSYRSRTEKPSENIFFEYFFSSESLAAAKEDFGAKLVKMPIENPGWLTEVCAVRKAHSWSQNQLSIKFFVHAKEMERAILRGESFPKMDIVIKYGVKVAVDKLLNKEYKRFAELPRAVYPFIPPKIEQPKGLKADFKFHRYQLEAISWMKSIENNIDKEFKYCDLAPWPPSHTSLLFDLRYNKVLPPTAVEDYIGTVKSRGGILADAVGLGKTVEIIGLTLTSQEDAHSELDENGLFNTNATLVICPNHLASQWSQEVQKFTNLKVSYLTTKENLKTTTYGDIIDSGFVIMTSQILKNKSYFSLGCGKKKVAVSIGGLAKRNLHVAENLEEVKIGTKLATVGPVMDHFHFKRIIVDEAHEIFTDPFAILFICQLKKTYAWYVSATPFPSDLLFGPMKKFLEIWEPDYSPDMTIGDEYEAYVENDLIISNLLWRNTKESIKDEYNVPDYEEELILLNFHPIEAAVHEYGDYGNNLQLCCGLLKEAKQTFDDYKDWYISCIKDEIENIKSNLKNWVDFKELLARQESKLKKFVSAPYILKDQQPNPEDIERLKLVNEYGTKMARLIHWLKDCMKQNDANRFILFSKYSSYLQKVKARLQSSGIGCVSLEGNVIHKSKVLKQFKEENIKVILLSLENSASGMNLIEANYVVLLDPMRGSAEEARAHELQAVGRAHRQGQDEKVTLVRFVIQDSVEEELYLRNKSSGREKKSGTKSLLAKSTSAGSLRNILPPHML